MAWRRVHGPHPLSCWHSLGGSTGSIPAPRGGQPAQLPLWQQGQPMTSRTAPSSSSGLPWVVGPCSGWPRSCTRHSTSVLSLPWWKLGSLLVLLGLPWLHQTCHPILRAHRCQLHQISSWHSSLSSASSLWLFFFLFLNRAMPPCSVHKPLFPLKRKAELLPLC